MIGGATILLFSSKKQLKTGKQKLRLWPGKEADGSFPTTTPGKVSGYYCISVYGSDISRIMPLYYFEMVGFLSSAHY